MNISETTISSTSKNHVHVVIDNNKTENAEVMLNPNLNQSKCEPDFQELKDTSKKVNRQIYIKTKFYIFIFHICTKQFGEILVLTSKNEEAHILPRGEKISIVLPVAVVWQQNFQNKYSFEQFKKKNQSWIFFFIFGCITNVLQS